MISTKDVAFVYVVVVESDELFSIVTNKVEISTLSFTIINFWSTSETLTVYFVSVQVPSYSFNPEKT